MWQPGRSPGGAEGSWRFGASAKLRRRTAGNDAWSRRQPPAGAVRPRAWRSPGPAARHRTGRSEVDPTQGRLWVAARDVARAPGGPGTAPAAVPAAAATTAIAAAAAAEPPASAATWTAAANAWTSRRGPRWAGRWQGHWREGPEGWKGLLYLQWRPPRPRLPEQGGQGQRQGRRRKGWQGQRWQGQALRRAQDQVAGRPCSPHIRLGPGRDWRIGVAGLVSGRGGHRRQGHRPQQEEEGQVQRQGQGGKTFFCHRHLRDGGGPRQGHRGLQQCAVVGSNSRPARVREREGGGPRLQLLDGRGGHGPSWRGRGGRRGRGRGVG
mmetsp:Transcript_101180/g.285257  ORF Transcript_101180/g.285257 Transcript_101180/m.285257 type:complete len:323 (-) Transcript_101180:2576-3544(-)